MEIALIVAMDENGVIGRDGRLPWHLPADLKRFKALTVGKPIIMGRKTYESIGRPLPERTNIVISRREGFAAPGCSVASSVEQALAMTKDADEVMVIGGAQLYTRMLPQARRIYLTEVHARVNGDTVFPPLDKSGWREVSREDFPADERHAHALTFKVLERIPAR